MDPYLTGIDIKNVIVGFSFEEVKMSNPIFNLMDVP